ncbi:hypothetical protein CERSUDRAFT_78473 [Gelatoporia subvermispora B]|uniref:F-box domain-containing protein n=1 Tax=Ceriporiopsis subvermispora (strain B) TaxID=914234 RepID=M2QGA3_CERS8|nr:hypothetical protein CERSUDRAFT_78473 [Gelatoporia subvermispora B]
MPMDSGTTSSTPSQPTAKGTDPPKAPTKRPSKRPMIRCQHDHWTPRRSFPPQAQSPRQVFEVTRWLYYWRNIISAQHTKVAFASHITFEAGPEPCMPDAGVKAREPAGCVYVCAQCYKNHFPPYRKGSVTHRGSRDVIIRSHNGTQLSINDALPPELTDRIIDCLHDECDALKSCSLTCRAWLPTARLHLMKSKLEIREYAKSEVSTHLKWFAAHSHLGAYICELDINIFSGWDAAAFSSLVPHLGHVEKLVIWWFPEDLPDMQALSRISPIVDLHFYIQEVVRSCADLVGFLRAFPKVESLRVTQLLQQKPDDSGWDEMANVLSALPLQHLEIAHWWTPLSKWVCRRPYPQLVSFVWRHGRWADLTLLRRVILAVSPTLKDVTVDFGNLEYNMTLNSGCVEAILACPILESVHLEFKRFSDSDAILILSQLANSQSIRRIHLVIFCHYRKYLEDNNGVAGLLENLGRWLEGDLPPALREVHLEISCDCDRSHDVMIPNSSRIGQICGGLQARGYLKTSRSKDQRHWTDF